jgi:hypothetical protein
MAITAVNARAGIASGASVKISSARPVARSDTSLASSRPDGVVCCCGGARLDAERGVVGGTSADPVGCRGSGAGAPFA